MMLPSQRLSCFSFDLANVRMALRAEGKAAEAETLYTEAVEAEGMSLCFIFSMCCYMLLLPEFVAVASVAFVSQGVLVVSVTGVAVADSCQFVHHVYATRSVPPWYFAICFSQVMRRVFGPDARPKGLLGWSSHLAKWLVKRVTNHL